MTTEERGIRVSRIIAAPPLLAGDTIEFGLTHEVNINGDKMWCKLGVVSKVLGTETPEEAVARVVEFTTVKVLDAAKSAAESVKNL